MHRPVRQLRHRHYEILRCVFEGQTYAAIARAFGCCRETVWNLVRSAPGQQVLAEWHARADQLTLDQPLRSGLVYRWLGRGLMRLPEGPARDRQLIALALARRAKARRRAQRQAGLPVDLPAVRRRSRAPCPASADSSSLDSAEPHAVSVPPGEGLHLEADRQPMAARTVALIERTSEREPTPPTSS
jgi:DNA-binding CsgD family transcriptional regulator